jgi:F-type H+-transporting ATPase subunit gamma
MALKQVKNKIIATQKTGKVTKAMEAVSAVKMRKSQQRAFAGKPFAEAAIRILYRIARSRGGKRMLEARRPNGGAECVIAITSDKGLAGNLNSAVIKETELYLRQYKKENVRMITFGRKAYEYFTRLGYTIDAEFQNVNDDVSLDDMNELRTLVSTKYEAGEYARVSVAFQSFVSTFEQNAVLHQVLPLDPLVLEMMVRDIVPKAGAWSDTEKELSEHMYTVEPNAEEVMRVLIPRLMQIMVYHALLESKASEHSARMVAMKNATDKTKEKARALTLVYNKERQAAITAEVSEITGGMEAMKS